MKNVEKKIFFFKIKTHFKKIFYIIIKNIMKEEKIYYIQN